MITQKKVEEAAKRQLGRYLLYYGNGELVAYEDKDTGYYWFKLSDGTWAWIA